MSSKYTCWVLLILVTSFMRGLCQIPAPECYAVDDQYLVQIPVSAYGNKTTGFKNAEAKTRCHSYCHTPENALYYGLKMADVQLTEEDVEGASLRGRTPRQLKIPELRFWLACRKIDSSKLKTKAQLVARVQALLDTDDYNNVVDPTKDQVYRKRKTGGHAVAGKSDTILLTDIVAPSTGWVKTISLSSIKDFGDVSISEYSLNSGKRAFKTPSTQPRKKTCVRPETRGYQFFIEHYLHDIWSIQQKEHVFFKARCFPSQKKNDNPHKLWCAIKLETLDVVKATCSCIAGLSGYCNHVMALLYQVSHYAHASLTTIPDDLAKTSLPQLWHKPRIAGIVAEPIMQVTPRVLKVHEDNSQLQLSTLYEARRPNAIVNDGDMLQDVQARLAAENPLYGITYMASAETANTEYCRTQLGTYVPKGSVLSYQLSLTEGNFHVDCNIHSLERFKCTESCIMQNIGYPPLPLDHMQQYIINNTLSPEIKGKLQSLMLTEVQMLNIELMTRDQANSDLWWTEREFRLTASAFAEICRRKKRNCEKLVERLQKKPNPSKPVKDPASIEHGKTHENKAVLKYHGYMNNIGHKVKIYPSGLVLRQDMPYLGCTPDRKVIDPIAHPHFGIVEAKCPYTYRSITPKEAANIDNDFCLEQTPLGLSLKKTHPYYQQVQGQMALTGAKWCDFIVYTFKGLFVERVAFDETFWNQMRDTLEKFYFKSFLPIALSDPTLV